MLRKIKEKYILREKYIYTCKLMDVATPQGYQLIPADVDTLKNVFNQHQHELTPAKYELLRQRLQCDTEQCLLISDTTIISGYCHIAYADHYNAWSNLWVKLAPGQVYFFDDYVFKDFRGRGLHKFSIAQRQHLARELGYTTAITIIDKSNTPSRKAYSSRRFNRDKRILHLPVLKKNIVVGK